MTTTAQAVTVNKSVTVKAGLEHAFKVFTEGFDTWWPRGHHIGKKPLQKAVIEPRAGGRCYDRGTDGSECDWGRVLAWEPPHRLVVTWQINGEWQYDPDPQHASEIEVRFTSEGLEQTRVELEHRLLDRLVGGQAIYDGIGQGGGWSSNLQRFAEAAATKE